MCIVKVFCVLDLFKPIAKMAEGVLLVIGEFVFDLETSGHSEQWNKTCVH